MCLLWLDLLQLCLAGRRPEIRLVDLVDCHYCLSSKFVALIFVIPFRFHFTHEPFYYL